MQPARPPCFAKAAVLERLWKDYFKDPSQWCDLRRNKRNPKAPDFRHRATHDLLWMDNIRNPSWVASMLQKLDTQTSVRISETQCSSTLNFKEAMSFVESATSDQISVDKIVPLLLKCTKEKNLAFAERVHALLRKNELDTHKLLGNYLVPMLAEVGSLQDAQSVFDRLTYRNEHSWCSLINGYVKSGELNQAFKLYRKMRNDSLHPNGCVYVALLKVCASLKDAGKGLELHADIDKAGLLEKDVYVGSSLVDMYAKCGLLKKAQEVFDKCPIRNAVLWNTLISGYANHECGKEALRCFEKMEDDGVSPTPITLTCVLKACGCAGAREKGEEVHDWIERNGLLERDKVLGNAVVDMYAKCGSFTKARQVFDKLRVPDVFAWTSLISGYVTCEHAAEALDCFEQMQYKGIPPNAVTYACGLKACGSIEHLKKGQEIHMEIVMKGLLENDLVLCSAMIDMYVKCSLLAEARQEFDKLKVRDVVLWNALISGYAKQENAQEALNCFDQMKIAGYSPDSVTYACALKACAISGATQKGAEVHADVESSGLLGESIIGNALVHMYAKCGAPLKAQEILDKLPVRSLVAWTSLIAGYAQVGESANVISTFERMMSDGVKPDLVTFVSVLNACSRAGQVDKAEFYFDSMTNDNEIIPTLEHYTCMIDLLGRSGRLERAMTMIKKMPFYPNQVVWHTVLGACRTWGNVEYGRHAFEHAMRLDAKDATAYVCMANIYADAGMEEEASMVEAMRVKNQASENSDDAGNV